MDAANNNFKQTYVDIHAPAFEEYSSFKSQIDQLQKSPQKSLDESSLGLSQTQLDKLSVVWLAQQNSALGRDITRSDLEAPQATAFDSLMAAHASDQFETVRHAHFDHEGGFLLIGSKEKDALTSKDIDASLQTIEKQRESMAYADPLIGDNGALFYRLSRVHDGVRSINYWDLKEARETDDYEHSRGTRLFTDEQRNLIDRMYKRWGKGDMRAIEERPQDSTMGCGGAITIDSLAKGTGFQSVNEMSTTFNQPKQSLTSSENSDAAEAARQQAIIQNARTMLQSGKEAIRAQSYYAVQPGQGFDQIARHVIAGEQGVAPTEADVLKYSRSVASMNGYDRDSYDAKVRSLQPGQSIQVHDSDWQLQQLMNSIGEVDDYVRNAIDH